MHDYDYNNLIIVAGNQIYLILMNVYILILIS
jgi:hypothetical protein